jgi:3-oxoacyl-(acyl-carrier-protein) synthase
MDATPRPCAGDPVVATGLGALRSHGGLQGEVLPWLKSRKMRKYMGKQDELAVIATGEALRCAGLQQAPDPARVGLYLCVGYIPFERADIDALALPSIRDGAFSMELFSTVGIEQVNPLLTFRCLPNMPIFHVSLNFGIRGPYFVTYPGIGQLYLALERAACALRAGEIDQALVGGVADQNNFLVEYHFSRLHGSPAARCDAAAVICLERRADAERRGARAMAELLELDIRYQAHDPLAGRCADLMEDEFGPASLGLALHGGKPAHEARTRDGFAVRSKWRLA